MLGEFGRRIVEARIKRAYDTLLGSRFDKAGMKAMGELLNIYYYDMGLKGGTWRNTSWCGTPALKCPLDLWIYQEIIHEAEPDIIIETGTHKGGTTLFLANVCDILKRGRIVSVDVEVLPGRPEHTRISYVTGSSVSEDVVAGIRSGVRPGERVLVILDSDHRAQHVLAELQAYGALVTPGSYMIVEDTNVNGHPVRPEFGPGPTEAIDRFLSANGGFVVEEKWEKFILTFNPRGYLRRTA